jgi:CheY-like chemotaxis protein
MENVPDFVVIDDDSINNMVCEQIINMIIPDAFIRTFVAPEEGIAYLASRYSMPGAKEVVLFLDINMPVLSGWEVLEEFKTFPEQIRKRIRIFILSSSVAENDKEQAGKNPLISGFIEKPLSVLMVQDALAAYAGKGDNLVSVV